MKEINVLNHYIGMRDLVTDDFTEFKWMPFVVGGLGLLFLRAAVQGTMSQLVDVIVLYPYFAGFALWSFAYKMYSYGHSLAPTAAVKVPPFMPPLFGYKQLANFEVYSYPTLASYALGAGRAAAAARGVPLVAARAARAAGGGRVILALAVRPPPPWGRRVRRTTCVTPATLEPRPASSQVSPLQRRIDEAAPGATVEVPAGTYTGDIEIDRPLTLIGRGRPLLVGSGAGSVIRVRADDVVIDGFDVDGRNGGDLGRDSSGIHVAARRASIRDCRVRRSLFGIYLRQADGSRVIRCRDRRASRAGIPARRAPASTRGTPTTSVSSRT